MQITIKLIQSTFVSSIILQTLHTKPTSCQKDVIEIKSKMTLMMTASWEMLLTDWMDAQGFQLERYAPSRFDEDNLSFYMLQVRDIIIRWRWPMYVKIISKLYLKVMNEILDYNKINTWWWYLFLHTCWWNRLLEADNIMCELIQHQSIYIGWTAKVLSL